MSERQKFAASANLIRKCRARSGKGGREMVELPLYHRILIGPFYLDDEIRKIGVYGSGENALKMLGNTVIAYWSGCFIDGGTEQVPLSPRRDEFG